MVAFSRSPRPFKQNKWANEEKVFFSHLQLEEDASKEKNLSDDERSEIT